MSEVTRVGRPILKRRHRSVLFSVRTLTSCKQASYSTSRALRGDFVASHRRFRALSRFRRYFFVSVVCFTFKPNTLSLQRSRDRLIYSAVPGLRRITGMRRRFFRKWIRAGRTKADALWLKRCCVNASAAGVTFIRVLVVCGRESKDAPVPGRTAVLGRDHRPPLPPCVGGRDNVPSDSADSVSVSVV